MGYLETFNNSIEYDEKIGDNGFSIGPSVSIYEENGKTKVKYVKCPSYKLTYDKSATKLFNTGYNIKRVWDENGLIFENDNPVRDIEIVVTENDIIINSAGTGFEYINPLIMLYPPYYETIEISLDNDNILESDVFGILLSKDHEYGVIGGRITQLYFQDGFGLMNGKIFLPGGMINETTADSFSFYVQRDGKILNTIINFIGVDGKTENETDRDVDGLPVIPQNMYIDCLTLESNVELDDFNNGVYMRLSVASGEAMTQIFPISVLKESHCQVIDNKKVIWPLGASIGDNQGKMCLCHIIWENNEPMSSIIDYDLIEETIVKVSASLNAVNITKTSDTNFTIKYEPYNRFKGLSLRNTNVSNIYDSLKNVTQLEKMQFYKCDFLTKLVVPNSVTTIIYGDAFEGCKNLEYIELPNTITNIEKLHFYNLPSLKTIVCYAQATQSHIFSVNNVPKGGVIKIPFGSDTSCWDDFVKYYDWTIEYI
jgi:hypothetical protein